MRSRSRRRNRGRRLVGWAGAGGTPPPAPDGLMAVLASDNGFWPHPLIFWW